MTSDLLARLEGARRAFGSAPAGDVERMIAEAGAASWSDAHSLIRLHETLLFLRAYPASPEVARLADRILDAFAGRVGALRNAGVDLAPLEEPEVSGIAGTALPAYFSYEAARSVVLRHARSIEINHEAWDTANLGAVLRRFVPLMDEDWPVEAHVPYRAWMAAGRRGGQPELAWLFERIAALPVEAREQALLYDSLRVPLYWELGSDSITRSRLRLARRELFCHTGPLIRRQEVDLKRELAGTPLTVERVRKAEAARILGLMVDTSATRYRELYGFNHPDLRSMVHVELGRGVEVFFFGVPPEWRLPLRAYHAGMFFKNGVPAGYIETLSVFERAEVGFNLYYTFREGESAWLYARLLKLVHQLLGSRCFSVDPYQIGDDNSEAINAGAFWFYRKLGFRPADAEVCRVLRREERAMLGNPRHRSGRRTLEKLARGSILWDGNGDEPGEWDRFSVRNIGLRAAASGGCPAGGLEVLFRLIPGLGEWPDRAMLASIAEAKCGPDEARYLRLMQRHARLRRAVIELGSAVPSGARQRG